METLINLHNILGVFMSLSTNLLGIPQKEFGLAGIHIGNVISQELDKQGKGFKAQYNPVAKKITVLNTSDLPPAILNKILYEPSASREYDAWNGYYPVVREERDKDGNLEVEFSPTRPTDLCSVDLEEPVSQQQFPLSCNHLNQSYLKSMFS